MDSQGTLPRRSVLFLCTGNSCRSQIAEALVNHFFGESWQAYSAGTRPAGYVHQSTLAALDELGISLRGRSKSVQVFRGHDFDLVVSVCDQSQEECPVWLGSGVKIHRGFQDPAAISGSDQETLQAFRNVRDQILTSLPQLLAAIPKGENDDQR